MCETINFDNLRECHCVQDDALVLNGRDRRRAVCRNRRGNNGALAVHLVLLVYADEREAEVDLQRQQLLDHNRSGNILSLQARWKLPN